ncbi:MAG: putative nuclease [Ignavibacteria bacterium]|nr:MAG: putative nuclease [Ignavibacteria bacterium]KAF0159134.1 MAG: putative nuclease [Ignavibacteria bacterium]
MADKLNKTEYKTFFLEIKEQIRKAQYNALRSVNRELIKLYWNIGKRIVENQNLHGWGKSIVENLSEDLQKEFPGVNGLSSRNLWRMRSFYSEYCNSLILPPMVAEIGWAHNVVIMEKCKEENERAFFLKITKEFGWTKNVLIHQIENGLYKKTLNNQTNFNKTLTPEIRKHAKLAVKDEYTFDFLELGEEHTERQLEISLINNIRKFLIEMGGDLAFIGNQYKLKVGSQEFFIDLLLYHRRLKCLLAVELKVGEFKPEYAGKMQFYLSVLNDKVKLPDENSSIGLILCKDKDRIIVEYALRDSTQPIGVATYKLFNKVPKELKKYLPSPSVIAEIFEETLLFENKPK